MNFFDRLTLRGPSKLIGTGTPEVEVGLIWGGRPQRSGVGDFRGRLDLGVGDPRGRLGQRSVG